MAELIYAVKNSRLKYLYRVLVLLPMVAPGLIYTLLWEKIYDPQLGLLTQILRAVGLVDPDFQVLIAAGKANDYHFVHAQNANVHIVEFVNGSAMLRQCDLAVLRAGATTLAEAAALGTAAILIPSPYVPNNHQVYNAREFVNAGAAEMIEEKDLSGERLADAVNRLMKDEAAATIYVKNIISTNFSATVIVTITQKRLNFNTFSRFCKNLFIMHIYYVNIVM